MAGFVYILSNPLFDRIKIGKSTKDPTKDRLDELNGETGTPEKYRCEYYAFVGNEHSLELKLHQKFSQFRPNPKREFFEVSVPEAIDAVRALADDYGGLKYEEVYYSEIIEELSLPAVPDEPTASPINKRTSAILQNKNVYLGDKKDGLKHGKGQTTYSTGECYDGSWQHNKRTGWGIYTWPNGQKYEGEWKDDLFHGRGQISYKGGQQYEGEWSEGKKHGSGTLTDPQMNLSTRKPLLFGKPQYFLNGKKYIGFFKHDYLHGKITVIDLDSGKQIRRVYKNGRVALFSSLLWNVDEFFGY